MRYRRHLNLIIRDACFVRPSAARKHKEGLPRFVWCANCGRSILYAENLYRTPDWDYWDASPSQLAGNNRSHFLTQRWKVLLWIKMNVWEYTIGPCYWLVFLHASKLPYLYRFQNIHCPNDVPFVLECGPQFVTEIGKAKVDSSWLKRQRGERMQSRELRHYNEGEWTRLVGITKTLKMCLKTINCKEVLLFVPSLYSVRIKG